MPPITILPAPIAEKYDLPPKYSSEERKKFGYLPVAMQKVVDTLRTPETKLGFIMQYFYFQNRAP